MVAGKQGADSILSLRPRAALILAAIVVLSVVAFATLKPWLAAADQADKKQLEQLEQDAARDRIASKGAHWAALDEQEFLPSRFSLVESVKLETAINRELARLAPGSQVSLAVVDPKTTQILYEKNAKTALIPASNQKLVTAAACIDLLGVDFDLSTEFLAFAEIEEGVLKSDLIIRGKFDPSVGPRFGSDPKTEMDKIAKALKACGLKEIHGHLRADTSYFEGSRRGPNWPKDAYWKWYMVEVTPFLFNDNQIELSCLLKRSARGVTTRAELAPAVGYGSIDTKVRAVSRNETVVGVQRNDRRDHFRLAGRVWSEGQGYKTEVNVHSGSRYYMAALRQALQQNGIKVLGENLAAKKTPAEPKLIYRRTFPLLDAAARMLKDSQNLYAEGLFRVLGAENQGEGSFAAARLVTEAWLKEAGIWQAETVIADGSGLSRDNRLSASQVIRILTYMARRDNAEDFRLALAEPGEKGTLRKRSHSLVGKLFAKTGTLTGHSALSGYIQSKSGQWLVFSLIIDHRLGRGKAAGPRQVQDAICRHLATLKAN